MDVRDLHRRRDYRRSTRRVPPMCADAASVVCPPLQERLSSVSIYGLTGGRAVVGLGVGAAPSGTNRATHIPTVTRRRIADRATRSHTHQGNDDEVVPSSAVWQLTRASIVSMPLHEPSQSMHART